jgi:hypothetical protein
MLTNINMNFNARLLQQANGGSDSSIGDLGIYFVWGGMTILLLGWCISSIRSGCWRRRVAAPVLLAHDQRLQPDPNSTLGERKLALLQLFATTEVTRVSVI